MRNVIRLSGLVVLGQLLVGFTAAGRLVLTARGQDLSWRRAGESLALQSGTGTVWAFHWDASATKPYFHPLALPGGAPLTWLRPPDHVWHCGVWFSWKFINGVNYWEEDAKTGRPAGLTQWSNVVVEARPDFSARITMDFTYAPPGQPAVLTERRVLDLTPPGPDGTYAVDWLSRFIAGAGAVELAATPVNAAKTAGGYGGLIWRVSPDLREWRALNDAGGRNLAVHGEPARAVDFSGALGTQEIGVAIFDHPDNPGHPGPWFLRLDEGKRYGLHGPGLLFGGPRRMAAGEALTLRYRLVVHPGRYDAAALRAATW